MMAKERRRSGVTKPRRPEGEHDALLRALDFNGIHCSDGIAAAYFRQSATAIRVLEGEADHWRRQYLVEEAKARRAGFDARCLEEQIAALLAASVGRNPEGQDAQRLGAEHEHAVPKGDAQPQQSGDKSHDQ